MGKIISKKKCPNHPDRPLWSKGLCYQCHLKEYGMVRLNKTPLKPMSERQKNILSIYRMMRRKYLREHMFCEIQLEGCTKFAEEIHHTAKKHTLATWLDKEKFMATCRNCHHKVEMSPKLAKELGIYNYKVD